MNNNVMLLSLLSLLIALSLFSCDKEAARNGGSASFSEGVTEVEPVETEVEPALKVEEERANLIQNGNFAQWHAGAPAPMGFVGSSDSKVSEVRRLPGKGSNAGNIADQMWHVDDRRTAVEDLFHTVVDGLERDTIYRLSVTAKAIYASTAGVSVFEADTDGVWHRLAPDLLDIKPHIDEEVEYAGAFKVGLTGKVLIASHANENTRLPCRVLWRSWRLEALRPGEEAEKVAELAPPASPEPFSLETDDRGRTVLNGNGDFERWRDGLPAGWRLKSGKVSRVITPGGSMVRMEQDPDHPDDMTWLEWWFQEEYLTGRRLVIQVFGKAEKPGALTFAVTAVTRDSNGERVTVSHNRTGSSGWIHYPAEGEWRGLFGYLDLDPNDDLRGVRLEIKHKPTAGGPSYIDDVVITMHE